MKNNKNKMVLTGIIILSAVFIGWGTVVELTIDEPIVDLMVLEVDSIGSDGSNYTPDSGNTSEGSITSVTDVFQPSITTENVVKNEYDVRIRGKKIYFEEQLCQDGQELIKKININKIKKTTKVHLVDNYADSVVYKDVKKLLEPLCNLDETMKD